MMRAVLLVIVAVAGMANAASTQPRCMTASATSPEEAAMRVLDGLAAADIRALRAATVSQEEFLESLWPWFRGVDPGDERTARFVWDQYALRSEAGLRAVFKTFAGRPLGFVSLRHGRVEEHGGFRLLTRPVLAVRSGNHVEEVRLFGSIVEQNGHFKVYGFKTD